MAGPSSAWSLEEHGLRPESDELEREFLHIS